MKTEYLYEFTVLARTLSFSRAAQALFLSQSTLSKHIQRMEEELGAQLLVRRHETYLVLPAGHPLMAHSAIGLHQLSGQTLIIPYADELFGPYAQRAARRAKLRAKAQFHPRGERRHGAAARFAQTGRAHRAPLCAYPRALRPLSGRRLQPELPL